MNLFKEVVSSRNDKGLAIFVTRQDLGHGLVSHRESVRTLSLWASWEKWHERVTPVQVPDSVCPSQGSLSGSHN